MFQLSLLRVLSFLQQTVSGIYDRVWTTAWLFTYGALAMPLIALPSYMNVSLARFHATLEACMIFSVLGGTIGTYFLNPGLWLTLARRQSRCSSTPTHGSKHVAWVWFGEQAACA